MKKLRTPLEVIEHLGGVDRVCELTGANAKQVWHWYGRAGKFPANTYVALKRALRRRDCYAPDHLWNMKGISDAA
jgi:hypothetical protein